MLSQLTWLSTNCQEKEKIKKKKNAIAPGCSDRRKHAKLRTRTALDIFHLIQTGNV